MHRTTRWGEDTKFIVSRYVDIHPHVISDDETRYPPSPLFGKRSEWSQERPSTVETLIESMDAAGVAKAAVVHSSTTYGFNNDYVVDYGVIWPHVATVEQAYNAVASCRYARPKHAPLYEPKGARGDGPVTAARY